MPLPVRVTPGGEIVAEPWRGTLMGNRGRLHGAEGRLGPARWRTRAWICCLTAFRGRRRPAMPETGYTALFFTDEAVALAAGHRPCGECRRAALAAFRKAWARAGLPGEAIAEIDRYLHAARLSPGRRQRIHEARFGTLPDGTFFAGGDGRPCLRWYGRCHAWEAGAYREASCPAASATVTVLTPRPTVAVLAAGYRPLAAPAG